MEIVSSPKGFDNVIVTPDHASPTKSATDP